MQGVKHLTNEELMKQNELQQKLIRSLLLMGEHLDRRVKLVQNGQHSIGDFTDFLIEFPMLMQEKVYNFRQQGLIFPENDTQNQLEVRNNGKTDNEQTDSTTGHI